MQEGVGHFGIFNGTRWRTEIQPRIREFIRTIEYSRGSLPTDKRYPRRSRHVEIAISPV
jgi:poly(3-hydroxybutyrate) depolymerase